MQTLKKKKKNAKSFHLVNAPQWWEKARLCWRTATKPAAMIKIWHFNLNNTWGNEWLTFTWNQIRLRPIPQMPLNLSATWHSLRGWFHRTIGSVWVPLYHVDNAWACGVWPDSGSTMSVFTRTGTSVWGPYCDLDNIPSKVSTCTANMFQHILN